MDLRTLVKIENDNRKERMIDESLGTYVLIYFGYMLVILFSAMYGDTKSDENYIVMFVIRAYLCGMVYHLQEVYLSYVKENGKRVNIFEKYIYTPIDFKMLRKAKLIVLAGSIAVPVIMGQIGAIIVRVGLYKNSGLRLWEWSVYMPLIIGCVFLMLKDVQYRRMCRKAGR